MNRKDSDYNKYLIEMHSLLMKEFTFVLGKNLLNIWGKDEFYA